MMNEISILRYCIPLKDHSNEKRGNKTLVKKDGLQ